MDKYAIDSIWTGAQTMTTYKREDGELWGDDAGWYVDKECIDTWDEGQVEVRVETWVLVDSYTEIMGDGVRFCVVCDTDWEDPNLPGDYPPLCAECSERVVGVLVP